MDKGGGVYMPINHEFPTCFCYCLPSLRHAWIYLQFLSHTFLLLAIYFKPITHFALEKVKLRHNSKITENCYKITLHMSNNHFCLWWWSMVHSNNFWLLMISIIDYKLKFKLPFYKSIKNKLLTFFICKNGKEKSN